MGRYLGLKGHALHYAVWAEAFFAVAIFGYNQGNAGGLLTTPSFARQFPSIDVLDAPENEKAHKSTMQGTIIALYTLLGIFGALACTLMGDKLGRRWTIFTAATVNLLGAILEASSFQLGQFIVARIILGLGTGGLIATVSVWQSELSKAESRGSHVSAFGIFCGTGLVLAMWFDFAFSFASGSIAWRVPFALCGVLSLITMTGILLLPESPRWLVKKGRSAEARSILELLHPGDQGTIDKELRDMEIALSMAESSSLTSLFRMGRQRIFHRVCLAATAQMMLQMTGINSIVYYASSVFVSDLGMPTREAQILAAASQFCLVLGSATCSFTVDRFGRRTLMMFSAACMSVCFMCLTGLVSDPSNPPALKAAIFFIFLYLCVYTIGFLGIPFLYASEVAPGQVRAAVCGVSTAVSWLFNFVVAEITPIAFNNLGYHYFIVYAVLNAAWVPLLYFFFPETGGRSLEEIDAIFTESHSVFDPPKIARKPPQELRSGLGHVVGSVDGKDSVSHVEEFDRKSDEKV